MPRFACISAAAAIFTAGLLVAPASAAPNNDPFVVSRQSAAAGGMEANKDAGASDVSAKGRFVVFESKADNLSPLANDVRNIYRYDTRSGGLELVSRNGAEGADGKSQDPAISANGRYVAFRSNARNLGPTDQNVFLNIYVYDAKRNRTELVSRQSASDGGRPANDWSEDPDISADGSVVSFTTTASNLGGPINTRKNVYVYNRDRRRAELVSRQSAGDGGDGANAGSSTDSQLSDGGRFVAFASGATNLGGRPKGIFSGYIYDRSRDRLDRVAPDAARRGSYSYVDALRGDARTVVFYVNSGRFGSGFFVEDRRGGHRRRLGQRLSDFDLSASGSVATAVEAFHRRIDDRRVPAERVVRVDLKTGRRHVVSDPLLRPDGDPRPADAWAPSISADGRAISFTSGISDAIETHGVPDLIFLSARSRPPAP